MDSRLLNVFHDDPFDGSYAQLNADFWSSENDLCSTMGQLTETLNGILPIAADAEHDVDIYNNGMLATEDHFRIANKIDATSNFQNKELLFYDDFAQHQLPADGGIEIITVDPNSLDSDSEDSTDDHDMSSAESKNIVMGYADFDDNQSQCSNATFRTRTDSSSIGDYESHTSDYDDSSTDEEEVEGDMINNQIVDINHEKRQDTLLSGIDEIPDLTVGLLAANGIDLDTSFQLPLEDIAVGNKKRTMSTNTIGSDVDVNNFDLAEFITNDDLTLTVPQVNSQLNNITATSTAVPAKRIEIPVKSNIDSDSDAESDVIVDIETVDVDIDKSLWKMATDNVVTTEDNVINDVTYEDNVKKDPSWSPKPNKKQDNISKETKVRSTTTVTAQSHTTNNAPNTRNFTIVPSKRQCDILKGKSATMKSKTTSKLSAGKSVAKKGPETTAGNASKAGSLTCRVGVGQGGKNLALLSQSFTAKENKPENNKTTEVAEEKPKVIQPAVQEKPVTPKVSDKVETAEQTQLAVKRKLNLEEYKRRRGDHSITGQTKCTKTSTETPVTHATVAQSVQIKHSKEVTTVVKTLRNQNSNPKQPVDPITEAKNKVLRMQELKRAQQLRIIDSTISAKVPRVTKLPPLKDIVKDTYCNVKDQHNEKSGGAKLHPDYEELIIVSAGSNTDISIPPLNVLPINTCERSILKSSALLYNMPRGLSSNSSLIASIQDVVVQKVVGPEQTSMSNGVTTPVSEKTQKGAEQHGEDKVIMHLRKDRIRPRMVSMGIQTDPQPGFTRLPKIPLKQRSDRNYRKQSDKTVVDETDSDASCERSTYNRHRNRSRSPNNRSRSRSADSLASSTERTGNTRQSDIAGGYSSRSSRRHRSSISSSYSESGRISRNTQRQARTSYKKRTKKYARNSSASSSSSSDRSERSRHRSRSHSRSRSPYYRRSYSRSRSRSRSISRASSRFRKPGANKNFASNNVSQPAVEERRIVYVGRIEEETTKDMLRRKFLPYGTIKQISIHYKDTGMKYGFVTYERSQDAFTVIDSSARDPTINMYDISFGGRRAFCRSSYADLDNAGINTYHSIVFPKVEAPPKEEDSFEALLQKVKAKMSANKTGPGANASKA